MPDEQMHRSRSGDNLLDLLQVDQNDRHVEVTDGGQHVIAGRIGEELTEDEVDGGSADKRANLLIVIFRSRHSSMMRFATHSLVVMMSPPTVSMTTA